MCHHSFGPYFRSLCHNYLVIYWSARYALSALLVNILHILCCFMLQYAPGFPHTLATSRVIFPASFRTLDSALTSGQTHCGDFLKIILAFIKLYTTSRAALRQQALSTASWSTSAAFAAVKSLNPAPLCPSSRDHRGTPAPCSSSSLLAPGQAVSGRRGDKKSW